MILENDYPPMPPDISKELHDFLLCCFQKEPSKRKSISELMYHPWIKKFGRRKSGHRVASRDSTEDLRALLHSVNAPQDLYGMDYIKDENFVEVAKKELETLTEKFEERSFVWVSPSEMHDDELKQTFCDLQAENRLLHLMLQQYHEKYNLSNSKTPSKGVSSAIERVESNFLKASNDFKMAQIVFNTQTIPYSKFPNGTRGILLMKKGKCYLIIQKDL